MWVIIPMCIIVSSCINFLKSFFHVFLDIMSLEMSNVFFHLSQLSINKKVNV